MATAGTSAGRSAAELTTSEVAGTDCDLSAALDGWVIVDFELTIASLTSCTLRLYADATASPAVPVYQAGIKQEYVFTGDTTGQFAVNVSGCRYFRASVQGAGTVASSSCAFSYRYNDYETTSRQDGEVRIG